MNTPFLDIDFDPNNPESLEGYQTFSPEEAGIQGKELYDKGIVPTFTNMPSSQLADSGQIAVDTNPPTSYEPSSERMKFVNDLVGFSKMLEDEIDKSLGSFSTPERDAKKQQLMNIGMNQFKQDYLTQLTQQRQNKFQQGGITTKGYSVGYSPNNNVWVATMPDGQQVPWNKEQHGDIQNARSNTQLPNKSFAEWEEPAKEQEFKNYIVSGTNTKNFSTRDAKSTNEFKEGLAKYQIEHGIDETAMRAIRAEANSLETSLKKQQPNRDMANSFVDNIGGQLREIEKLYNEIDRTNAKIANVPIRALATQIKGSGKEQALASYLMEVSREIGKLSTGSQSSIAELSVETQKKWDKIHDGTLPWKEMKDVLEATRKQSEIRLQSLDNTIKNTQQKFDGLIDKYSSKKQSIKYNPSDVVRRGKKGNRRVVQLRDGSIVDE